MRFNGAAVPDAAIYRLLARAPQLAERAKDAPHSAGLSSYQRAAA